MRYGWAYRDEHKRLLEVNPRGRAFAPVVEFYAVDTDGESVVVAVPLSEAEELARRILREVPGE